MDLREIIAMIRISGDLSLTRCSLGIRSFPPGHSVVIMCSPRQTRLPG